MEKIRLMRNCGGYDVVGIMFFSTYGRDDIPLKTRLKIIRTKNYDTMILFRYLWTMPERAGETLRDTLPGAMWET